ncbi:hypothetical protein IW261DRAFT_1562591 [Armillaria novae-zelandiae]|uniref:Uncharacterized protein n=1 Tax=Armillaria novae-zelandiae TaxID=153914 RepID=A0AA39U9N5_9AGAR|nr:hypothetical protein IW261DRAFT_1562591 [Armillaria novae-zelandiae]
MALKHQNIIIQGKWYWKLIGEYDNSQNEEKVTHTETVEKTTSYTVSTFRQDVVNETKKAIESNTIQAGAGASYGPVSASRMMKSQSEDTQETKSKTDETFEVGPHILTPRGAKRGEESAGEVDIDVVIEEQEFIKDVKVVYSDEASGQPDGRGFGGKYVSLVPVYTKDIREAAVSFEVIIQADPIHEEGLPISLQARVATTGRSSDRYTKEYIRSLGYDDSTDDINKGREKDFLYLFWKSKVPYASG